MTLEDKVNKLIKKATIVDKNVYNFGMFNLQHIDFQAFGTIYFDELIINKFNVVFKVRGYVFAKFQKSMEI